MFSLYNSGTVLPTGKMTLESYKVMLDFLLTAKKRKAHLPSGKINTLYTIKLSLDIFIHKWNTQIHKHIQRYTSIQVFLLLDYLVFKSTLKLAFTSWMGIH